MSGGWTPCLECPEGLLGLGIRKAMGWHNTNCTLYSVHLQIDKQRPRIEDHSPPREHRLRDLHRFLPVRPPPSSSPLPSPSPPPPLPLLLLFPSFPPSLLSFLHPTNPHPHSTINIHPSASGFVIAAGCILGVCAGLLWTAQGSLMLGYPTENEKGRFIAIFWSIFNLGGVVGASVSLGQNFHSEVSCFASVIWHWCGWAEGGGRDGEGRAGMDRVRRRQSARRTPICLTNIGEIGPKLVPGQRCTALPPPRHRLFWVE